MKASPERPAVLIADDDGDIRSMMSLRFDEWGYQPHQAADKGQLFRQLEKVRPALVLLDLRFGEHDGLEVLDQLKRAKPGLPVILFTAHGTIETAIAAMKIGAFDYLTKPPDLNRLRVIAGQAVKAVQSNPTPAPAPEPTGQSRPILGESAAIAELQGMINRVAPTEASVMILGESGVGKELVARAIHQKSRRAAGPFLALNMAALPRELVESTLFGHEKGAFTSADSSQRGCCELADRGTLFLDEIGEMDINLQAKLLRFLQERAFRRVGGSALISVDVRVLTATNRDPAEQVRKGLLREDLYYRLRVVPVTVPPLRDRSDDVEPLARAFLAEAVTRNHLPSRELSDEAIELLEGYDWPGNVRELENLMEQLAILAPGDVIRAVDLPPEVRLRQPLGDANLRPIDEIERNAIVAALEKSHGNVKEAARLLGLGYATVYRKIKRFNIGAAERGRDLKSAGPAN